MHFIQSSIKNTSWQKVLKKTKLVTESYLDKVEDVSLILCLHHLSKWHCHLYSFTQTKWKGIRSYIQLLLFYDCWSVNQHVLTSLPNIFCVHSIFLNYLPNYYNSIITAFHYKMVLLEYITENAIAFLKTLKKLHSTRNYRVNTLLTSLVQFHSLHSRNIIMSLFHIRDLHLLSCHCQCLFNLQIA